MSVDPVQSGTEHSEGLEAELSADDLRELDAWLAIRSAAPDQEVGFPDDEAGRPRRPSPSKPGRPMPMRPVTPRKRRVRPTPLADSEPVHAHAGGGGLWIRRRGCVVILNVFT